MRQSIDVKVNVTEAAALGEELWTKATVTLPDAGDLGPHPVVCFAFPGGGYSRGYFTFDAPGSSHGGQAGWHAARGWVFVSCDHLYVGGSDDPSQPELLSFENMAAVNAATVEHIWGRLLQGSLSTDFPALDKAVRLGIGQSMGGGLLIVQQGQHGTFDGVAILGFSAHQTVLAMPPGTPRPPFPFVPRGTTGFLVTSKLPTDQEQNPDFATREDGLPISTWGFHYDDEPEELVRADIVDFPIRRDPMPEWGSATIPPFTIAMMSPGVVALEASLIRVPVFVGVGERDAARGL